MDPREIRWEGVDWIRVAQDRSQWWAVVKAVMNLWVPQETGNFLTSFSRRKLFHGVSYRLQTSLFLLVGISILVRPMQTDIPTCLFGCRLGHKNAAC